MQRRTGLILVLVLLGVSLALVLLLKLVENSAREGGHVGQTALQAEANRVLGPKASVPQKIDDLTGDGAPEYVSVLTDSLGRPARFAVVTIARKKVRTLILATESAITDGNEHQLVAMEAARYGFGYSILPCSGKLPRLQLAQLNAAGQPSTDPLFLAWDATTKAFAPADGC
jgi:hypothetical protein